MAVAIEHHAWPNARNAISNVILVWEEGYYRCFQLSSSKVCRMGVISEPNITAPGDLKECIVPP